ncbi:MAG: DJ-1/PfpI family protein [Cyanobacteria bacterium P01_H01_bin.74]
MTTKQKIIAMVIAPNQFRDEELLVPREQFIKAGFQVKTLSTQAGDATGMLGAVEHITETVDALLPLIQRNILDTLVVVGGMGAPEFLWNNTTLHQAIQMMMQQKRLVAAICISGVVLAKAGVLSDKRATVWETPESKIALETAGAVFTGEAVTEDGNIITANGPDAAKAFGMHILNYLGVEPV